MRLSNFPEELLRTLSDIVPVEEVREIGANITRTTALGSAPRVEATPLEFRQESWLRR